MGLPLQGNVARGNFGQDLTVRGGIYIAPSTAETFYVGAQADGDKGDLRTRSFATIDQALNACRHDRGDVIRVRPNYTENISATGWANMKRGVRIEGMSLGTLRPTLTWNVAGSTLALATANMQLDNLNLFLCPAAGSVTVTAGITITAAGVFITNCYIKMADSAARLVTTGITVGTGADDCKIIGNEIWGVIAGTPTNCIVVTAAVNRLIIGNNKVDMALSATTMGLVSFTAAALGTLITNNTFDQLLASSTVALNGFAGVGGVVEYNSLGIQNATGAATAIGVPGNWKMIQNFATVPGKAGLIVGTVSG